MLSDSQKWRVLVGVLIGAWLLYQLAPVLTPFLVAGLLAYLGDPLVDRLQSRRAPRTLATAIVVILTGVVVVLGQLAWYRSLARLPAAVRARFSKRTEGGRTVVYVGRVTETRMTLVGRLLAQLCRTEIESRRWALTRRKSGIRRRSSPRYSTARGPRVC